MDIFWLEAQPWSYPAGAAVPVYATSSDLSLAVFVLGAGIEYLPVLDGGPILTTTVFNGSFTGTVDAARGQLNITDGPGDVDIWGSYAWPGRPVQIYTASLDVSNPIAPVIGARSQIFNGRAESYDPDGATLNLTTLKPTRVLASTTYAGTGGLEGSPALLSTTKALSIGYQINRAAKLLDSTKMLFRVNAAGVLSSIVAVREGGTPLDQPFIYHSSFADLNAATVPATEIHVHLATGTFRLGFTPQGDIAADYRGTAASQAYPSTIGALISVLLAVSGWNPAMIDTGSLAAISSAIPGEVEYHDDSGVSVDDALTALMQGCGGYWDVDALGVFYVGLVQMASSADFSVGDEGVGDYDLLETDFLPTRAPFWRNRVAWGFNPSVVSFSDTQYGATPDQLALIASATSLAAGKNTSFFSTTAPTTGVAGDLWYNLITKLWYRYDATPGLANPWILTQDQGIGNAIAAAAGAQATADGKISTYYQDAQPAAPDYGDLWVRPSDNPRIVRTWTGTIWDQVSTFGATAAQVTQINANQAQLTAITSTGVLSAGAEKVTLTNIKQGLDQEYSSAVAVSNSFPGIYGADLTAVQRAQASSDYAALNNYLGGLSPPWNDASQNTNVTPGQINQLFANAEVSMQALEAANDKVARDRAAAAQSSVDKISSDNVVSAGQETQDLIDDWNSVNATYSQLHGESVGFIGTYGSDYTLAPRAGADAAINNLAGYLNSISPAWYDTSQDHNVNGSYMSSLFAAAESANEALRSANNGIARQKATWTNVLDDGGRPQNNADVTALSQHALTQPNPLNVAADYQGNIAAGQLPATISFRHTVGPNDISSGATYTASASPSSGATISINNNAGDDNRGNLTVSGLTAGAVTVTVASTYGGVTLYSVLGIVRNNAAAPVAGSGGGSGASSASSNSSFTAPGSNTSFIEMARVAAVTVGSGGNVALTASLSFSVVSSGSDDGTGEVPQTYLVTQWQYSTDGGSGWGNVGGSVESSAPASNYFSISPPKGQRSSPGSASNSQNAGLSNGTSVIFRLLGATEGASINSVTGTIVATPS